AILEIIPYVGPIFSGALAIIVAMTDSLTLGLYTLIAFVVIQQLENQLFVPAVTNLTTSLNPVVALIAILMGAQIFGVIGLVLAIPAAVLIQELIEGWSESKKRNKGLGL
ncbi:MAG: AI-2E family transporter, partial [bacterium]|nr:AI-2E family transporter [bacterium]